MNEYKDNHEIRIIVGSMRMRFFQYDKKHNRYNARTSWLRTVV